MRFRNSSRYHLEHVNRAAAEALPAGSRVLDAGAGNCPYRELFAHARYETADFAQIDKQYGEITYVCDIAAIPVESESFDFVLLNQTLEHVPEPKAVLKELHRVLKPGGHILYTGPFYYEEHEVPYDFYRYSQFGLRHLFCEAGFEIQKLEWLEGYFGTLGYQLERAYRNLPLAAAAYGGGVGGISMVPLAAILRTVFAFSSTLFYALDRRVKFTAAGHPKNYYLFAAKNPAAR